MIKKRTYPHELIGQEVEIVKSTNPSHFGIKGKVVDETKSTIKIKQQNGIKVLLKNNVHFKIIKTGEVVSGEEIAKRPEERIKG